ncbi:AAA family ATPase [Pistricoccus aurantiacus]|uniref:bifunctional aminoglycoside phosphotransferase/ATP-binding protein n=1 Tax=Pistricoccus aurantiacus TaxID=1883414 RepID=UPI00362C5616
MSDTLIQALQDATCYDHPIGKIEIHETSASWLLLTGEHAYKIKKSLNDGSLLDASTPDKRRRLGEREVRLNRRLYAERYLGVVPISGSPASPRINDASAPIEYAVKMRRCSRRQLANVLQVEDELYRESIDELIALMVDFHEQAATQDAPDRETPEVGAATLDPLEEAFASIRGCLDECLDDLEDRQTLEALEQQAREMHARLEDCFAARRREGFLRKRLGSRAIEKALYRQSSDFADHEAGAAPRQGDVACDLAFLLMDLESRNKTSFANHSLNRYLELSGDYSLVKVLGFYKLYHALDRARAAIIGYSQAMDSEKRQALLSKYRHYLDLSRRYSCFQFPYLVIGVGVPGSGKSRFTAEMVQRLGSVRLRSDVERKRLHGFTHEASSAGKALYQPGATARTYQRLAKLCGILLEASQTVCIDATCLKREQRDLFRHQAEARGLAVIIVSFEADPAVLERRIKKRAQRSGESPDASLEILKRQLRRFDAFDDDERRYLVRLDTTAANASETLVDLIQQQVRIV